LEAVVMAAGEGTRLRPLTERWPKPVLPIDGRPVLATLLRELAAAKLRRVWLVTGHLAEQVEGLAGDGSGFGVEVLSVRQPAPLGSADAVQRALAAGAAEPFIVTAADTLFRRGDVACSP
jgi:NDP-sugar pyrophosphorylase family protein